MIVWVLMENTACDARFHAEHGLSLYLETCGRKILFDMGQSAAFAENAHKLGVHLDAVDTAVLSHGHYDHGGGLRTFLEINDHAPVYISRYAFEKHGNAAGKEIGLDPALAAHPRLIFTGERCQIGAGLTLLSCAERAPHVPVDAAGLTVQANGQTAPEDFRHEQYLLIEENAKRILVSGCSHKGVRNLVEWFEPDVLIGGFHFMKIDPEGPEKHRLDEAAQHLLRHKTQYYTCHCTGNAQYAYLKERMHTQLHALHSGQTVQL